MELLLFSNECFCVCDWKNQRFEFGVSVFTVLFVFIVDFTLLKSLFSVQILFGAKPLLHTDWSCAVEELVSCRRISCTNSNSTRILRRVWSPSVWSEAVWERNSCDTWCIWIQFSSYVWVLLQIAGNTSLASSLLCVGDTASSRNPFHKECCVPN